MITTNLVGISLHAAGLLATVRHPGAGEVGCVAHVHRHPLLDRLRLDDDLPVSWEQIFSNHSGKPSFTTTQPLVSRANPG